MTVDYLDQLREYQFSDLSDLARVTALAIEQSGGGSTATQYVFYWQPGGTANGNVFADFAELYAAASALRASNPPSNNENPILCVVDDSDGSLNIPLGGYDFTGWVWRPATYRLSSPMVVTFEDGAVFKLADNPQTYFYVDGPIIFVNAGATSPIHTTSTQQEVAAILSNGAVLAGSAAGPFIGSATAGNVYVYLDEATFGDGTNLASAGSRTTVVAVNKSTWGTGAMTAGAFFYDAGTQISGTFHAGLLAELIDLAEQVSYRSGPQWPPGEGPVDVQAMGDYFASLLSNNPQQQSSPAPGPSPLTPAASLLNLTATLAVGGWFLVTINVPCSSAVSPDLLEMTILLDGAAISGAPIAEATTASDASSVVNLAITWGIQVPVDGAAHALGVTIQSMTGGAGTTLTPGTVVASAIERLPPP